MVRRDITYFVDLASWIFPVFSIWSYYWDHRKLRLSGKRFVVFHVIGTWKYLYKSANWWHGIPPQGSSMSFLQSSSMSISNMFVYAPVIMPSNWYLWCSQKKKKKNWCLWWRPFYMEQKPTWKGTLSVSFLDIFSACSEPLKHLGRVFFWHMHDPWQWHVLCYFFCLSRCILFNMIFKILVVTCILYV